MKFSFNLTQAIGLSLLAGIGLVGCTTKADVHPESSGCSTLATVRLCHGRTTVCPTEHTELELPNGTRLRPSGPLWAAYQPRQQDGQTLRIGYSIVPRITNDAPGYENATITCLEAIVRCGTN